MLLKYGRQKTLILDMKIESQKKSKEVYDIGQRTERG